jgi:hypothetical protein
MGIKDKLKKIGKVGGAALVIGATGGVGGAAALAAKNSVEKATYKVDSWGPLKEDASMVGMHYSPAAALDTEDDVIISGTPFDGKHKVKRGRTRNDVWIKPGKPVTESGTSGSFKVKTSVGARLRNLGSAGTAEVRTGAKKTGDAVKKAAGGVGSMIWTKLKWILLAIVIFMILYLIFTTYLKAKVTQAVAPTPMPVQMA